MSSGGTLLLHARNLIARGWTQEADARDAQGRSIQPWNPNAVTWSLLGALVAALESEAEKNEPLAIRELAVACAALAAVIDDDSLEAWNDRRARTREDVLAAIDRA